MTKYTTEFDSVFCSRSKKYGLRKLLLKSIAICESSLNKDAYRYEPAFWDKYLKNNPLYKDKEIALVSASHGLFQIMFPTACELLETKAELTREDLCNPFLNTELAAKYIRKILDKVIAQRVCDKYYWFSPIEVVMARYNSGYTSNPSDDGVLRGQKYADRIMKTWCDLEKEEQECEGD